MTNESLQQKIETLKAMANTDSDIQNGNIGGFSQGCICGERSAALLALEVIEELILTTK